MKKITKKQAKIEFIKLLFIACGMSILLWGMIFIGSNIAVELWQYFN